jgi:hypothetical protein
MKRMNVSAAPLALYFVIALLVASVGDRAALAADVPPSIPPAVSASAIPATPPPNGPVTIVVSDGVHSAITVVASGTVASNTTTQQSTAKGYSPKTGQLADEPITLTTTILAAFRDDQRWTIAVDTAVTSPDATGLVALMRCVAIATAPTPSKPVTVPLQCVGDGHPNLTATLSTAAVSI